MPLCVGAECGREGKGKTCHCVWARNAERRGKGEDTCHCVWARNAEGRGKGEDVTRICRQKNNVTHTNTCDMYMSLVTLRHIQDPMLLS